MHAAMSQIIVCLMGDMTNRPCYTIRFGEVMDYKLLSIQLNKVTCEVFQNWSRSWKTNTIWIS